MCQMNTRSYLVPQCKTKETLHEIKEREKNGLRKCFEHNPISLWNLLLEILVPISLVSFILMELYVRTSNSSICCYGYCY